MTFIQLKRIKNAKSNDQAIAAYGSYVKYFKFVSAQVGKSERKGWSPARVAYSRALKIAPVFHQALIDFGGFELLAEAIESHSF